MKTALAVLLAVGVGIALASLLVSRDLSARHRAEMAAKRAEIAALQAALEAARQQEAQTSPALEAATNFLPSAVARLSPAEIIVKLIGLAAGPSARTPTGQRQIIYWLEELVANGQLAVAPIGEFLSRYEDLEVDPGSFTGRGSRDRLPGDFSTPPSLRFGLFDVLRRIGGAEAEKILATALTQTGRGLEVAYLTRILHEMSPDRYRAQAVAVAKNLLTNSGAFSSPGPLDRNHRDYLFAVLAFYNDTSFAETAKTQIVRADGQVDRGAVRYLQGAMGAESISIARQAYADPSLTNAASKEVFARLALGFAGADPRATEFYTETINDNSLTANHRSNLIEDLNEDGFPDPRNLTPNDLTLIDKRIALIEQLAPNAMDKVNSDAFQEAYKDLVNMRAKITGEPATSTTLPHLRNQARATQAGQ